jgi:ABC-type phosphate/phosphonate transport system substrate-binding protein
MFINEGTLDPGKTIILASTPPFDHCNFTAKRVLPSAISDNFSRGLLEMSFLDPAVRPYMEMEGLKQWLPARTSGYEQLEQAVAKFGFFEVPITSGTV